MMTRHLKALGLALVAVLALSAIAAQGASATSDTFHATQAPVALTGEETSNLTLEIAGLKIACGELTLIGTQAEKEVSSITLTPTYSLCGNPAGSTSLRDEGCNFVFDPETTENVHTKKEDGLVSLSCQHTGRTSIEVAGCVTSFQDTHPLTEGTVNQKLHGVTFKNDGEAPHEAIELEINISTLSYTVVGQNCLVLGRKPGTYKDGKLTGSATIRAYEDGQPHQTDRQVGLWVG